ncbi:MocR-like ectoine utilization transcription factor EhuR [Marinivivus vitaminiproducens]|uniref:MocR-like ectoine utilization transcription factor EhuR n=1 Tax=Marinivivus vitaminiproducens TaxID=3035935 RepID=UPI0027A3C1A9|nr:PLP-dependent aminotransferase family protein [Geminicoccaceae bacterium SCSIO 64248]
MTIWQPDASSLTRPAFLSLAAQIARAVASGQLRPGERLPTQRRMAEELGLSVQTVSRAYDELVRRGLVSGETGRGTFVRAQRSEPDPPFIPERPHDVVDLSILKPVGEALHVERLKATLADLAGDLAPNLALSFRPSNIFARHRAVAVDWLRRCGLEVSPGQVCLTNGATAGMTVALMAAAPPGATVATEALGHHTLIALAAYLGQKLEGIAMDEDGIRPDALARACAAGTIRALFVQPTGVGPTGLVMSAGRRSDLVAVARRFDLVIIENDPLGPLVEDRPAPFAALAPERTCHVTTFTKPVMPGLRTGYLTVPDRLVGAVANRHLVTNWIATPLIAEIATRWAEDGTALDLVRWQRKALGRRHAIARSVLSEHAVTTSPNALHVWLPLADGRDEAEFVAQVRRRGVAIAPGRSFRIDAPSHPPAVRIALGSTTEGELRAGLSVVAELLQSAPEPILFSI